MTDYHGPVADGQVAGRDLDPDAVGGSGQRSGQTTWEVSAYSGSQTIQHLPGKGTVSRPESDKW